MALSVRGASTWSVVQEFQSHKSRLDRIARDLKQLRDRASDRKEDSGESVQAATCVESDRRHDREQMRALLDEFQEKITTMRQAVKYLKKYCALRRMDTQKLVQMESLINALIDDIDTSSSLKSLQKVSVQCKRVMNRLEDALEDVKVELFFSARALNN